MLEPEVIYEDKDFLAVNKPSGLLVHEARIAKRKASDVSRSTLHAPREKTLVDWLLERYPEIKSVGDDPALRPGIVHRLDKDASGIMLVARTQNGFEYLKSLFQTRQIKKTYLAVVRGVPKKGTGTITAPIGIKNGTLKRSVRSEKMVKEAVTEYKPVKRIAWNVERAEHKPRESREFSLLEVEPKTGRTHQIRVHLASIGHPIVGDRLYGPKKHASRFTLHASRLMLHALSLEFTTADGRRLKLEAEPPPDFQSAIQELEN